MNVQAAPLTDAPEETTPYAPSRKSTARYDAGDSVESAGQTVIGLLNQAVEAADANTKHALDVALKLSHQLQAAEARIANLETDLTHYKERAERAEHWLNYIRSEIEQNFLRRLTADVRAPSSRKNVNLVA
jgi:hypothetical protein